MSRLFYKIILTIFVLLFNFKKVLNVDYEEINKQCLDLFDENYFLVRKSTKQSWFGIFENVVDKNKMEHKVYNGLWDGKFKGHYPCVIQSQSSTKNLIVAPFKGYLEEEDKKFPIMCRPKFDFMNWYEGKRSYSVSNRKCKRWDNQSIFNKEEFGTPVAEVHTFCRNPDSSPCGPWCFLENTTGTVRGTVREPCFGTCYNEIYSNKSARCFDKDFWPETKEQTFFQEAFTPNPYDKFYYTNVTRNDGGSCSLKRMSHEDILRIDEYGLPYDPWGWESVPLTGHSPDGPWGYSCYSGQPDREKNVPTSFACQDLQRVCIERSKEVGLMYQGFRNYTVSGRPCIPWSQVKYVHMPTYVGFKDLWKVLFISNFTVNTQTKFDNKDFLLKPDDESARCTDLGSLVGAYTVDVYKYPIELMQGPSCFVFDEFSNLIVEKCFETCEDVAIDKLDCVPPEEYSSFQYTGSRSRTINNETCLNWGNGDRNFCRLKNNESISCFTASSPDVLQPCFKKCERNESRSDVTYNTFFYSPCTEPKYRSCCEQPDFARTTTVPQVTVTTAKVTGVPSTHLPFEPIPIPEDLLNDEGTLTEPRVRPTAIGEIIVAILFIVGTTVLIVVFCKTDLNDF